MNTKIIVSLLTILAIGAIATARTVAYFTDMQSSNGNTFTAGTLKLGIDTNGTSWSTGSAKFTVGNLKPGDSGTASSGTIANTGSIDAGQLTLKAANIVSAENGCSSDSERSEDANCNVAGDAGELCSALSITLNVGGAPVWTGTVGALTSGQNLGVLAAGASKTYSIAYSLPGTAGNSVQGDGCAFDLVASVQQ